MWLTQWTTKLFILGMLIISAGNGVYCHAEIRPDFLMDSDPSLKIPDAVKNFSPALKALWLSALDRPESDMQRLAAETIARGHEYGVPDLVEAIPKLQALLVAEKSHPATRFAAARALITLESQESSDKLFEVTQKYEADLRQLIDPALAKWNYAPAIAVWKDRLSKPEVRQRDLILALRGLAAARDSSVTPALLSIANDETRSVDIRLEAATAAGQCATSNLESDAARMADIETKRLAIYPICACRLLARHESEQARSILIQLATHQVSMVASAALHRLLEIDSSLVLPLAEAAMNHTDPNVRRAGALAYLKHPEAERIAPLARLLADPHPGVRREVCQELYNLSDQLSLTEAIRTSAMEVLSQEAWEGQEQAALLLGILEHQPAAERLVELLESPRAEVGVSSAWALRKVAVAETIPAISNKIQRQTDRRQQGYDSPLDHQVAHLCEAVGVLKADSEIPLLKQYIPKIAIMGEHSRCAAIWAIGLIQERKPDTELENALMGRIRDFADTDPELDSVKEKCAITLARMKASDQSMALKGLAISDRFAIRVAVALRWAVKDLTDEDLPPVKPQFLPTGKWFLEPYTP